MTVTPLIAQCVMCFRTASAQQAERAKVLNTGIIILLIPPMLVIGGVLFLAWWKGRAAPNTGSLTTEAAPQLE